MLAKLMNFLVSSSEGKPITSQGIPLVCNTNSYFGITITVKFTQNVASQDTLDITPVPNKGLVNMALESCWINSAVQIVNRTTLIQHLIGRIIQKYCNCSNLICQEYQRMLKLSYRKNIYHCTHQWNHVCQMLQACWLAEYNSNHLKLIYSFFISECTVQLYNGKV